MYYMDFQFFVPDLSELRFFRSILFNSLNIADLHLSIILNSQEVYYE